MIDYYNVIPEKTKLLNKHFTQGRGGAKIEFITRHHLAMVGTTEQVWNVWQARAASAHYVVEPDGITGQIVYDRNTSWANADAWANARTIAIEHSNSGGNAQDWPISQATIIGGARLAAALCRFYGLGRPVFGRNIRDHREFTGTSCPHHLANGGKYHKQWMDEAQRFYDLLDKRLVTPLGTPIMPEDKDEDMAFTDDDRKKLNQLHDVFFKGATSRSAFAVDDTEHKLGDLVRNLDGRQHEEAVLSAAERAGLTPEQVVAQLREGKNFAQIEGAGK